MHRRVLGLLICDRTILLKKWKYFRFRQLVDRLRKLDALNLILVELVSITQRCH